MAWPIELCSQQTINAAAFLVTSVNFVLYAVAKRQRERASATMAQVSDDIMHHMKASHAVYSAGRADIACAVLARLNDSIGPLDVSELRALCTQAVAEANNAASAPPEREGMQ